VRFSKLVDGEAGIAGQQERLDSGGPVQIDNLFVGKNRVSGQAFSAHQQQEQQEDGAQ
jgi:hypothetical protein